MRHLSRSDRALLASAWEEMARAPRALIGRSSVTRSACVSARYNGYCSRCERPIRIGEVIRFHSDFAGYVHDGCRPPTPTTRASGGSEAPRSGAGRKVTDRQPPVCADCHLAHNGECW